MTTQASHHDARHHNEQSLEGDALAARLRRDAAALHRPAPADLHDHVMARLDMAAVQSMGPRDAVLHRFRPIPWTAGLAACLLAAGGSAIVVGVLAARHPKVQVLEVARSMGETAHPKSIDAGNAPPPHENAPAPRHVASPPTELVDRLFSLNVRTAASVRLEQPMLHEARALARAGEAVLDGTLAYLPESMRLRLDRP